MKVREEYSSVMLKVIIFMAHKGVHSLAFVCDNVTWPSATSNS